MSRTARSIAAASAVVALACAQAAREYRDPDPVHGPTALVVMSNPFYEAPFTSTARAIVHVYERAPDCTKTYLGSVSLIEPERSVRVAAGRDAIFLLSISELDLYGSSSCNVGIGFAPRVDRRYRLLLRDAFGYRCHAEVREESAEPVAAFDPEVCEPH